AHPRWRLEIPTSKNGNWKIVVMSPHTMTNEIGEIDMAKVWDAMKETFPNVDNTLQSLKLKA
ncbi:hypothetical protein CR513_22337, partial [Mucuna pruriens]